MNGSKKYKNIMENSMMRRAVITLILGVAFFAFLIPNVNAGSSYLSSYDHALHTDTLQSDKATRGSIKSSGHYDHFSCVGYSAFLHHLIFHTSFTETTVSAYYRADKPALPARSDSEKSHSYANLHFGQFPVTAISKSHSTFPKTLDIASKRLRVIRATILLI
jgi:hypothetical protein